MTDLDRKARLDLTPELVAAARTVGATHGRVPAIGDNAIRLVTAARQLAHAVLMAAPDDMLREHSPPGGPYRKDHGHHCELHIGHEGDHACPNASAACRTTSATIESAPLGPAQQRRQLRPKR